jgi:hypothetical protein
MMLIQPSNMSKVLAITGSKDHPATVKKQSQASFNKISAGVTQVNNLMKAPTPDKAKATTAIQSLSQAVSEYTKGS